MLDRVKPQRTTGIAGAAQLPPPDPEWDHAIEELLAGRIGMRTAYQPIADLHRGKVAGYEALTRFAGPPVASPDHWFREAGRRGLAATTEALALASALDDIDRLPRNTFLSVNISPLLLGTDAVREVLGDRNLGGIVLELTEHEPIGDYDAVAVALEPYRSAGAKVAVDDAGAGYAGLNHLLSLRPEILKLDRSLVAGLHLNEAKRVLVEMMGTFAGRIDSWLLAEGVELVEELDALVRLGIPLAQGYVLARPERAFSELTGSAAERIRRRAAEHRRGPNLVGALTDTATTVPEDDPALAIERLALSPETTWLVVVDPERGRPLGLMDRHLCQSGERIPLLTVGAREPSAAVLRRAMVRDRGRRYDPVAVVDGAGRLLGLVFVERLVGQVLDQLG